MISKISDFFTNYRNIGIAAAVVLSVAAVVYAVASRSFFSGSQPPKTAPKPATLPTRSVRPASKTQIQARVTGVDGSICTVSVMLSNQQKKTFNIDCGEDEAVHVRGSVPNLVKRACTLGLLNEKSGKEQNLGQLSSSIKKAEKQKKLAQLQQQTDSLTKWLDQAAGNS